MIVCVECNIKMKPKKNGVLLVEIDQKRGPFRASYSDLWECQICKKQIVSGISLSPVLERGSTSDEDFDKKLSKLKLIEKIIECYHANGE